MLQYTPFVKISFVLLFVAGSVKVNAQTALQFNDKLAAITDSLYAKGQGWGVKFNEVKATKEFSKLTPYRMNLERFVDVKIAEVKKMKDVSGSQNLRQAILSFLVMEKTMIQKGFSPMEKLNSSSSDDDIQKALDNLIKESENEGLELSKVNKAQDEYASRNGFKIESAKKDE